MKRAEKLGGNRMYGYKREVKCGYPEAVTKIKEELKKEGFGVLSEIDVKDTLKKKLNVDFDNYVILGACNPPFAYQALQVMKDVGLMMPCNVVVFSDQDRTYVAAALPTVLLGLVQKNQLKGLADQIEAKLKKAVDGVA
jgi:uncharacterized protein (DUF302 family)